MFFFCLQSFSCIKTFASLSPPPPLPFVFLLILNFLLLLLNLNKHGYNRIFFKIDETWPIKETYLKQRIKKKNCLIKKKRKRKRKRKRKLKKQISKKKKYIGRVLVGPRVNIPFQPFFFFFVFLFS